MNSFSATKSALLLVDLQNDFIHPRGAYGRAGVRSNAISALPRRLKPVADTIRSAGGCVISTHFTLIPSKNGTPFISSHLQEIRPFLGKGDFQSKTWGHELVELLQPADFTIEKISFSAFYQSRLEWILNQSGISTLIFGGIVTDGGVATTVRSAHVREFENIVLSDGCASFSNDVHENSISSLSTVANICSSAEMIEIINESSTP